MGYFYHYTASSESICRFLISRSIRLDGRGPALIHKGRQWMSRPSRIHACRASVATHHCQSGRRLYRDTKQHDRHIEFTELAIAIDTSYNFAGLDCSQRRTFSAPSFSAISLFSSASAINFSPFVGSSKTSSVLRYAPSLSGA